MTRSALEECTDPEGLGEDIRLGRARRHGQGAGQGGRGPAHPVFRGASGHLQVGGVGVYVFIGRLKGRAWESRLLLVYRNADSFLMQPRCGLRGQIQLRVSYTVPSVLIVWFSSPQ